MASSRHYYCGVYKSILERLISEIRNITGDDENEVRAEFDGCVHRAIETLELTAKENPLEFPVNLDCANNWNDVLNAIARKASQNEREGRIANKIVYGGYYHDKIDQYDFISPLSISGNEIYRKDGNIVISYDKAHKEEAIERLNNIVFSLMLSLPPKKVNLSIVDFGMDGAAGFLTRGLDPGIYHDEVIVEQNAYNDLLKRLQALMAQRIKRYGDMMEQNEKIGKIQEPIELVLLIGDPDRFDYRLNELKPIWENGRKGGVIFISMKDTAVVPPRDVKPALTGLNYVEVSSSHRHYHIQKSHTARLTPVAQLPELAELCFEYLNNGFQAKEEAVKVMDTAQLEDDYDDCGNGILEVAVGAAERSVAHFRMDLVDHIHAFILGMSGSGKSVLLHNIIANLIGKYSPEQLQLYLLDFKLGGVEFNRYRDTKHVKALLVDNSDNSVVLEIMRELNTAMYERGKMLKSAGVQRIDEYNRKNQDKPLPQILAVIDECHNIFNLQGGQHTGLQREVLGILTKITKEGRNQGVHLVMATQTLYGADIPGDILNNISDHYLLKCAQPDSEKLAPGNSNITSGLPTGKVFYHHQSGNILFQGYYLGDSALEKKVHLANEKAVSRQSNGQFYFSGSQIFTLDNSVFEKIGKNANALTLTPGETCSLRHEPFAIKLPNLDAQNILISGINSPLVTRTTLALIGSAIMWNENSADKYRILVINCLEPNERLTQWLKNGKIEAIDESFERGEIIAKLANDIGCERVIPTILVIIGQQLFRELKKDLPINIEVEELPEVSLSESAGPTDADLNLENGIEDISEVSEEVEEVDLGFDETDSCFELDESSEENDINQMPQGNFKKLETTFGKAIRTILRNGPEYGVHTVMQIDKLGNLLFEEYLAKKQLYSLFSHFLIHRSDEATSNAFDLRDNVRPENLTADEERLKAIYYNEERDTCVTFSPYILTN